MTRRLLLIAALLLPAQILLAGFPTARTDSRMVYVPRTTHMILFGGLTAFDSATKLTYQLNDTWEWTGLRWVQRFPIDSPPVRSSHVMVYDTKRERIVVFGGRNNDGELADTWVYQNDDWQQIATATAPPKRYLAGGAYDPVRDRLVVFGGVYNTTATDGTITANNLYDTWEFDGTNWTQRSATGPAVNKPTLVYDKARQQLLMVGINDTFATQMYSYNGADGTWTQVKPTTLPTCVNEGAAAFQTHNNTVVFTGGVCPASTSTEETFEWNGTNWTKIAVTFNSGNTAGTALAYDESRQVVIEFGGSPPLDLPTSRTFAYQFTNWFPVPIGDSPAPRSLMTFNSDPDNDGIWMYGGLNEEQNYFDFWKYQNGQWVNQTTTGGPASCLGPAASYDTDRKRLVLVCASADTWEWDGTAWHAFGSLKTTPVHTQFRKMVYDPTLKQTVLFGGFDLSAYSDQTWLWNGTEWTRQKKNPAPSRSHYSIWFDPTLKKTVMFGGIGRLTADDRITRYNDMWALDATGWTELKPANLPGPRYGAQTAIDPTTGHVFLFGGLRLDTAADNTQKQVYANDLWEWDGTNWTQVQTTGLPPGRENGAFDWDPSLQRLTLFGGWAGSYFSDIWVFKNGVWSPMSEQLGRRRRAGKS